MKSYTLTDLRNCLADVDIYAGDLVMVHSSLPALGRLADHDVADSASAVVAELRRNLGPQGTLVVPTFNFGFCRGEVFDREKTPSKNMGVISEIVRCLPGAVRSRHPMQSIAAIGPLADTICAPDTPSAFDQRGSFDVLLKSNAILLLLGVDFQAASIIHYAEQRQRVPYRHWKEFTGPYEDNGVKKIKSYRMYVRDSDMDPQLIMSIIENELKSRSQLRMTSLGGSLVRSCTFQDLIESTIFLLRRNPYFMVDK